MPLGVSPKKYSTVSSPYVVYKHEFYFQHSSNIFTSIYLIYSLILNGRFIEGDLVDLSLSLTQVYIIRHAVNYRPVAIRHGGRYNYDLKECRERKKEEKSSIIKEEEEEGKETEQQNPSKELDCN